MILRKIKLNTFFARTKAKVTTGLAKITSSRFADSLQPVEIADNSGIKVVPYSFENKHAAWPFPAGAKLPDMGAVPTGAATFDPTLNMSFSTEKVDVAIANVTTAQMNVAIGQTLQKEVWDNLEQDPSGGSLNEPGKKADARKNRPWLFHTGFANALHEVSRVTTLGAEKYTPGGWATVPDGINRYMEAFGRHETALAKGETFDDGPKGLGPDIYHKASMIWNLLASLELELREKKK